MTYADTGQPVPHALVTCTRSFYEADANGRFRVSRGPWRTPHFGVRAQSPDAAPYLMAFKRGEWPKGAVEQSVDVALARGVVVRGKTTEEETGRPIEGAVVRVTRYSQPGTEVPPSMETVAVTGPDGTYRVAAPPSAGYLVVQGPDDDYVLHEFHGEGTMYIAGPGRPRLYAHAYRAVDLKPGDPDHEVDLTLRRGAALHGRAVGPDGQPVRDGCVCSRLMLRTQADGGWKLWLDPKHESLSQLRDGRFVLHGLDPSSAAEVPAYFLEPERKLGAVARFSGRSVADGPVTVRLEPCGTALARLVTGDGKPLDHCALRRDGRRVGGHPGAAAAKGRGKDGPLFAQEASVMQLDGVNYGNEFQPDAQGWLTLPALIPGATYRIADHTPVFGGGDPVIRKEFTVQPGETLVVGDILIARPQGRN